MSDDEEMDYGMDDLLGFMDEDNAPPHHGWWRSAPFPLNDLVVRAISCFLIRVHHLSIP